MKGHVPARLGDYEVHRAWEGFSSIRQVSSGEIMHSRTDPMEEARKVYVEQSRLAEWLRENATEPLVLWDVGLGAAANATAAMECCESGPARRPLRIVSFDKDLDPLRLAVANREAFPYLRVGPVEAIVNDGEWRAQGADLRWTLLQGDFRETMHCAPAPHIIFYDMFSTKTSGALWSAGIFRELFGICGNRAAELVTYTCSTANRAALLAAGFFVARGRNAGEKEETTIALTPPALTASPTQTCDLLSPAWLAKWERSAAKFPADIPPEQHSAFQKIIRNHEQFRKSPPAVRLLSTT